MRIRRATPLDSPTAATFSVPAFLTDELYQYTHPYAAENQISFRDFYLRRFKLRQVSPGYVVFVAIAESSDDREKYRPNEAADPHDNMGSLQGECSTEEEVVGYAMWYRHGDSEEAKRWQTQSWAEFLLAYRVALFAGLESMLLCAQDSHVSLFHLDRSVSPSRMRNLEAAGFFSDEFSSLPERWHLKNICVDPKYQRRGIGASLISWGLEQAEKEKVPVTLSASTVAESLYRKIGFKTWSRLDIPGVRGVKKNDLCGAAIHTRVQNYTYEPDK
ncbi:MAG: hypothetical protein Q9181_006167 [Wetmoreana brouardii]